ncbi:MAG TPA: FAD:protein FMN transferase [Jatrophihabitans sp.]|nr:FAD:protein FMN transferase [Jatrophihabitans sp.]
MTARVAELGVAEWTVWTTTASLIVTDAAALPTARALVDEQLARVDRAASRFRADSEVCRLAAASGHPGAGTAAVVSDDLAAILQAALASAADTDGAVDPTLGRDLVRLGYGGTGRTGAPGVEIRRRVTWRDVRLSGREIRMPAGTLLDFGATAKAWATDRCAERVAEHCGCGVLVNLGGDIRVAGPAPEDGWQVLVSDGPAEPESLIKLDPATALATSSTLHRRWTSGDESMHHVIDPWLRRPAAETWRTVSVAAGSCVRANALSTAAIVRANDAVGMLRREGVTARLVAADGSVVRVGGWPE